jgi:two-component system sensor histidine kinase/response regulator
MTAAMTRPTSPIKLLLVDDLAENLFSLSALLQRDGIEILEARSGAEALELLLAHSIALALVDVQMPEMDGFELAELMRGSERTRGVPIIFVTAGASNEQRVFKGYEAGAVDFLQKPIEPHVLKSKVDVFVELAQQRQQLAREIEEKTERLRLNEMFSAMLGHDLRRPLSTILMNAILQEKKAPDDTARKSASRTLESATRMSRMISDMLDLARARLAGGIPIDYRPLDLLAVVEKTVDEHRAVATDRTIEIEHRGSLSGAWDADRIAQSAANVIGNAIQHGDRARAIRCVLDGRDPDQVTLAVTSGGRIPADLLPHVFDPFRSRETYRSRSEGLGLGLYIVQQIVFAHRGTIDVEVGGDVGVDDTTTFRITLPRYQDSVSVR